LIDQSAGVTGSRGPDLPTVPAPTPTGRPVPRAALTVDRGALGLHPGGTHLAHASLRSPGRVDGGVVGVVQGHSAPRPLVVPAPGHLPGPALRGGPPVPEERWAAIRATLPAYDPLVTPSPERESSRGTVRTWFGALCGASAGLVRRPRPGRGSPPSEKPDFSRCRACGGRRGHAPDCRPG